PNLAGVLLLPSRTTPEHLGVDHLIEELGGISFHLTPTTFFQVNTAAAEALLDLARAGLAPSPADRLLDLYCGAGAFALPLAGAVTAVLGIEEHAGSIADARITAEKNA